ncbi:metal-dependent hydrolase [Leptospira langatensis]|uniref:Metal-dependent hydrolase n=1 Tax=Leptospira langatensis TaxID=2484983 RepID=A0A5F1ZT07_9LEPT|nr:metal-dependent hydrolase [Leptospira langatensis]TGK00320.1 metal-dependent hydrolase [Leptospira langatensis]TGL41043.1 metal-dependent hydrolase [Leptospira langatensis]
MADNRTHIQAGLITGAILSILKDWNRNDLNMDQKFGRAILSASIGAIGGKLPDIFEPADHPNHRQGAHSVAFMGFSYATLQEFKEKYPEWELIIDPLLAGYASHLVLDSKTPMGIPWF